MKWKRPTASDVRLALGPPPSDPRLAAACDAASEHFSAVPRVKRGDWLSEHNERGQTMRQFSRKSTAARPHGVYHTIALVPYGDFRDVGPELECLAAVAGAFFGCRCEVFPAVPVTAVSAGARTGDEGQRQLLATEILEHLQKLKLSRHVFVRVAVTLVDLYPRESWNFVFGLARCIDGCGVFSFARYDPEERFFATGSSRRDAAGEALLFRRSAKVLLHEVGHLFGFSHCPYFSCKLQDVPDGGGLLLLWRTLTAVPFRRFDERQQPLGGVGRQAAGLVSRVPSQAVVGHLYGPRRPIQRHC